MSFVYIIQCHNRFKIGVSNNPEQRLATINGKQNPYQCILIAKKKFKTDKEAYRYESNLHKETPGRVRGEWFLLHHEYVQNLISEKQFTSICDPKEIDVDLFTKMKNLENQEQRLREKEAIILQNAHNKMMFLAEVMANDIIKERAMEIFIQLLDFAKSNMLKSMLEDFLSRKGSVLPRDMIPLKFEAPEKVKSLLVKYGFDPENREEIASFVRLFEYGARYKIPPTS